MGRRDRRQGSHEVRWKWRGAAGTACEVHQGGRRTLGCAVLPATAQHLQGDSGFKALLL